MKNILLIIVIGLLISCSPKVPTSPVKEENIVYGRMEEVILKDGTRCVTWKEGYGGGLSCDWNKETQKNSEVKNGQ